METPTSQKELENRLREALYEEIIQDGEIGKILGLGTHEKLTEILRCTDYRQKLFLNLLIYKIRRPLEGSPFKLSIKEEDLTDFKLGSYPLLPVQLVDLLNSKGIILPLEKEDYEAIWDLLFKLNHNRATFILVIKPTDSLETAEPESVAEENFRKITQILKKTITSYFKLVEVDGSYQLSNEKGTIIYTVETILTLKRLEIFPDYIVDLFQSINRRYGYILKEVPDFYISQSELSFLLYKTFCEAFPDFIKMEKHNSYEN